jgi:hypothetical protein
MKKVLLNLLFCLIVIGGLRSQVTLDVNDFLLIDRSDEVGIPYYTLEYEEYLVANEKYVINFSDNNHSFSCFGLGWNISQSGANKNDFEIIYKSSTDGVAWTGQQYLDVEWAPEDTPTGLYWSDALFSYDAESYSHYQIEFSSPVDAEGLRIDIFDGNAHNVFNGEEDEKNMNESNDNAKIDSRNCPSFPSMITRSQWCGGSASCNQVNAWYNPTYINPTHVVMHHGASPNSYSDGEAIVRSYYNYHVNTLGWADIGYNYLIDKFGNFYQGRHNPNLPGTDVRGAHAGAANPGSIGVNFLGNLDTEIATQVQLNKLYDLLAYWYDSRGINVLGSSGMQTQAYGWQTQPNFTAHRDINPTTCPSNDIYNQMQNIRIQTQAVIDDCNNPSDEIEPSTEVNTLYEWRGYDFWTNFNDQDDPGGSGVNTRFYQVLEFDGQEWRANAANGYFNDNFNSSIHPSWTSFSGSWNIVNGELVQNDENEGNSNIYAELTQTNDRIYQYHWQMEIDGITSTNRRAGIHFFADDAEGPHRGNSYLAWWRADDNEFHLYRVENNTLDLVQTVSLTIDLNTSMDCKVTFDPQSGLIEVFTDNVLTASWTDPLPLQSGGFISLRNGDSEVSYNNFKVRTSRTSFEKITVGPQTVKDSRYESLNSTQDACRINSMVIDYADNWSSAYAKNIYVDWTNPTTSIDLTGNYQNSDFSVDFEDEDNTNGSGVTRSFYQVIDQNNGNWSANTDRGFYFDSLNQSSFNPLWEVVSGNWQLVNGFMEQTDEGENNTNIYAPLAQNLSNRYLYHFEMKIDGTGSNKRGGFHYFVDDPTALERGNSYFLWFRQDLSTVEFFRVENNIFSQEATFPFEFNANEWMDVKLVYDRVTGEHLAYVDNNLIGEWTDPNPHSDGDYISFRSGNSNLGIRNLAVFRTRFPSVTVTVGTPQSDIRYQSIDNTSYAGMIRSIVHDQAHNLSNIEEEGIIVGFGTSDLTNEELDFDVFPNPFDRSFIIKGIDAEQYSFSLWTIGGQQIATTRNVGDKQIVITTPYGLANGTYLLRITDNKGNIFDRKLIKQ